MFFVMVVIEDLHDIHVAMESDHVFRLFQCFLFDNRFLFGVREGIVDDLDGDSRFTIFLIVDRGHLVLLLSFTLSF